MGLYTRIKTNRVTRAVALALLKCASLANSFVPKDGKRVLFYGSMRDHIMDSNEAMYSWLVDRGLDTYFDLVICLTGGGDRKPVPGRHRTVGALRGVWEYMRSGYVFYTHGGMRMRPSVGQTVVNLWHGMPLKTIGKLTDDEMFAHEDIDDFTLTLATSPAFVPIISAAFGCEKEKVIVSGLPRNDYLAKGGVNLAPYGGPEVATRILWMPTYRQSSDGRFDNVSSHSATGLPIIIGADQLRELDEALVAESVALFVKAHPFAYGLNAKDMRGLKNVVFVDDDDIETTGQRLYEFVSAFSALLTDYSSVYLDFLLLDKPIGFTLDDYEGYRVKRGFVFDEPKALMPGHHIYDMEGLLSFIHDVANGVDIYQNARLEVRNFVHEYKGFNSRGHLVERIGLLKELEI